MTKSQRLKLKERSRYLFVNPDDQNDDDADGGDQSKHLSDKDEYTDGFFTSDSDVYMPDKTDASINEMQLLSQNQTALDISQSLFNDRTLVNPEKQAKILVAKIHKRNSILITDQQS